MIIKKRFQMLLLPASFFLLSCTTIAKPVFTEIVHQRPEKRLDSYTFDPKSSVISRVQTAPDFLLAYLKKIDKKDVYSPYMPTRDEMAMIEDYLEKLPPLHKRVLQERLIGIYFVNNFWGSGMADYVLGDRDELYTIMIINPETMKHDMTAWMTYRENTIYKKDDASIKITVDCGTLYTGLMYALLHETTHIVDYVMNFTPYPDKDMQLLGKTRPETDFVKNVWADFKRPEARYDVPKRKDITLYGFKNGPHLSLKDAVPLYERLSQTPFPSLCGWIAWPEDFAEYVTWSYFTKKLNQPYSISVYENDKSVFMFAPLSSKLVGERGRTIQNIYVKSENPGERIR